MRTTCPRCTTILEYSAVAPKFCSNCGESLGTVTAIPDPPTDPYATVPFPGPLGSSGNGRLPTHVGCYRLVRPLGSGGMGTVYEAEDEDGRRVAIKLIRPEYADTPEAVERFRREGRLASTILHPRCVFVVDADEEQGRPYIVMELMPGKNLVDLVQKDGPMPVAEAIRRIIDVIEGLQEAHRLGVIHRDVKPSNCFIDADGRLKVGDFGLAKSLISADQMTRSGAFLGTILYASPEQIRHEVLDHRSDIYSVCATLFYMLTGRAPFQEEDSAAALVKAATESAPGIRTFRKEIPRALEEVINRGLARVRRSRWQTLEDLRLALLPFLEPTHTLGEIGRRVVAYLIDIPAFTVLELVVMSAVRELLPVPTAGNAGALGASLVVSLLCGPLYFAYFEAKWGCTPGKWLLRLRVRDTGSGDHPSVWQSYFRAAILIGCKDLTTILTLVLLPFTGLRFVNGAATVDDLLGLIFLIGLLPFLSGAAGFAILASSMRRTNGYRGLHELASDTQVIRLPESRPRVLVPPALAAWPKSDAVPARPSIPVQFYRIDSVARSDETESVFYATDRGLERPVWIWQRPGTAEAIPAARRALSRGSRPRWLEGGEQDGRRYDAFIAESGCLLADVVAKRRLGWADTISLLQQLADELHLAAETNTLPPTLSVEQVWIQAGGRVILLETPVRSSASPATNGIELLQQVAALSLERKARPQGDLKRPIAAPVSGSAAALLDRLMGVHAPPPDLAALRAELAQAREHPDEVNRPWRAVQLAASAVTWAPGLALMFAVGPVLSLIAYVFCVMGLAAADVRIARIDDDLAHFPEPDEEVQLLSAKADLRAGREALLADRNTILASWTWLGRNGVGQLEKRLLEDFRKRVESYNLDSPPPEESFDALLLSDDPTAGPSAFATAGLRDWTTYAMFFAFPILWAINAAVFRGGLVLRFFGLALVGADGRRASPVRCLWRTVVTWFPVAVLLTLSLVFELWRVAGSRGDDVAGRYALAWAAWGCWWGAAGLLVVYALSALRRPDHGPHDRAAGTFLVPR